MNQLKHDQRVLVDTVWQYYQEHGRHTLPWRQTTDPYRVLVSEIMLQQTQVSRVVPRYRDFLRKFSSTKKLAEAPLAEVLGCWQGLGYNRRAKSLQQAAMIVRNTYHGRWPDSEEQLRSLPGIGVYTARAVIAFAYNQPVALLETNIKTVLLVHCYPGEYEVTEKQLYDVVANVVDEKRSREWYWALMDYGAYLKTNYRKEHRRVRGYRQQSAFHGSNREVRGAILRYLFQKQKVTKTMVLSELPFSAERICVQLEALTQEGLAQVNEHGVWQLPQ